MSQKRRKQIVDRLHHLGYRAAWMLTTKDTKLDFTLEAFVGGKHGVVIVQQMYNPEGVEVYAPTVQSNSMKDLLNSL